MRACVASSPSNNVATDSVVFLSLSVGLNIFIKLVQRLSRLKPALTLNQRSHNSIVSAFFKGIYLSSSTNAEVGTALFVFRGTVGAGGEERNMRSR